MPSRGGARSGGARTPLSDYVREWWEKASASGMSKSAFLSRCVDPQDPSTVLYPQWFDTLLSGRGPMPELWRLRALAAGMGVEVDLLKRLAAAQWLELEEFRAPGGDVILIPVRPGLSEAARRRVRRVAEAAVAAELDE